MFTFTQDERKVIVFLAVTVLIGVGINYLSKKYLSLKRITKISQDVGKIDLNSADLDGLMEASGIGKTIAQRIIEYRSQKGKFLVLEELKDVRGITAARFEKIKEQVTLK